MTDAEKIAALQQQLSDLSGQLERATERVDYWMAREQVLRLALKWMDRKGGLGLDVHDRICAALSAHTEEGA